MAIDYTALLPADATQVQILTLRALQEWRDGIASGTDYFTQIGSNGRDPSLYIIKVIQEIRDNS